MDEMKLVAAVLTAGLMASKAGGAQPGQAVGFYIDVLKALAERQADIAEAVKGKR